MPKYLNLGCGPRFCARPDWVNVDFHSTSPDVTAYNLLKGVPFPDNTFDAVYHSHVLEHFTRKDGRLFISECFRVLKPGGVLRIATPDLEEICRIYLSTLCKAESGDVTWFERYEWIVLEMYDQCVRTKSGGDMAVYLRSGKPMDTEFIVSRIGTIGRDILSTPSHTSLEQPGRPMRMVEGMKYIISNTHNKIRRAIVSTLLTKQERNAFDIGLFRLNGEVHQWMYDRFSLRIMLTEVGFVEVEQCSASISRIPKWNSYLLDVDSDGFVHAPSSLFVEGVKRI